MNRSHIIPTGLLLAAVFAGFVSSGYTSGVSTATCGITVFYPGDCNYHDPGTFFEVCNNSIPKSGGGGGQAITAGGSCGSYPDDPTINCGAGAANGPAPAE